MSKRRVIKRIVLAVLLVVVVAIAAAVITIHTNYGRELIREQVEAQLDNTFIGGASIARVKGSPFGELWLEGVVINGPDREPAITVGKLKLEVGLLALVSKQARIGGLEAHDVEVVLKRDPDGQLQVSRMMKPKTDDEKSGWAVDIPELAVHRARVALQTADGWMHLDDLEIRGSAHMPTDDPIEASVHLTGMWREREAAIGLVATVVSDPAENITQVPTLITRVGGVTVAANAVRFAPASDTRAMLVEGHVTIDAPAAAVAHLAPSVKLPADVAVTVFASARAPWTDVEVIGHVGATPVHAVVAADLAARHARGSVSSDAVDVTTLSGGKVRGVVAVVASFDSRMSAAGELPATTAQVAFSGQVAELPPADGTIALSIAGDRTSAVVGLTGPSLTANVTAQLRKIGDAITLERGTVVAATSNPRRATGGLAPVRGAIDLDLRASGRLVPAPDLAIEGRVAGRRLRTKGLSVASLDLAIDASHLPKRPRGRAQLVLEDLVRDDMQLGRLQVNAANRSDGKIAVAVRSRPKVNPWRIDVDALVTPPGRGGVVTVDLVHHMIRAASAGEWIGDSGRIEIGPEELVVRDVRSRGADGEISIAATLDRAGRGEGDLVAKIDATRIDLDNLSSTYRGRVDAHVDVTRTRGRWAGAVDVSAKGVALDPRTVTIDADLKVLARADQLVVDANASSLGLGGATLTLDIDAPKDIANVEMWRHLHRGVIRKGRVSFERLDLAKLADLAGRTGEVSGMLDGDVVLDANTTGGTIRIRDVVVPALKLDGAIDADLRVAQSGTDVITPTLSGTLGRLGRFQATAELATPPHLFDIAAWQRLGKGAMRGATLRVEDLAIDSALLDRAGIATELRGRATISAELAAAMRSAQVAVDVTELRGSPIAEPIEAHFAAAIDEESAKTSLTVRAKTATLVEVRGTIPVTMAEIQRDPAAALAKKLDLTATIPSAPAPALLAVFGRTEITGGTIAGEVRIAGTVREPTIKARITGSMISVPPGPNNKPIKTLESIVAVASWDGKAGKLTLDGKQQDGTLRVVASGNPRDLDTGTLTLEAKKFDLVPLLVFAPGPAGGAAGRLDANLRAVGLNPANMKLRGELHLADARVPVAPQIGTLRRAKVDVVVGDAVMTVAVVGRLGAGHVSMNSRFELTGVTPTSGAATAVLRKVSPIGTVEPVIDANVTAKLRRENNAWIADVVVTNGVVVVPKGRGEKLKPVGMPGDMVFATGKRIEEIVGGEPELPPKEPNLIVNLTLRATHVESPEVRSIIKGKLKLSADPRSVGIVGTIDADRGVLDLFGRRYVVERAGIRFDGSTDPLLDLMITHDFPEVTTITQVRGRLSKPDLIMSSDPGVYSQGQLLGFLLGGEPNGDPNSGSARERVADAGTSFVANKLGGYVRNALPIDIDVLRYEASSASSSAAVTVGTWLTRSLFLAYRRRLESRPDENAGEGEVEYWLSRRVMVEGVVGDRGYNGVDLLWRKRY